MASGGKGRHHRNTIEFNVKERPRQRKRKIEFDDQEEHVDGPTILPYNFERKQIKLDSNYGSKQDSSYGSKLQGEHSRWHRGRAEHPGCSSKFLSSKKASMSYKSEHTSQRGKKYHARQRNQDHDAIPSDFIPPRKRRRLEQDCESKRFPLSSYRIQRKKHTSRDFHNVSGDQSHKREQNGPRSNTHQVQSWVHNMVNFTFECIMSLNDLPLEELVKKLSSRIKAFQYTLDKKSLLEKADVMEALIKVLSKIADPSTLSNESYRKACLQILGEALSDRCARFQLCLKMYIKNELSSVKKFSQQKYDAVMLSHEEAIRCLCKFFRNLLHALPTSSKSWLPMEDLQHSVEQIPDSIPYKESLLEDIKTLFVLLEEVRQKHLKQKDNSQAWNNSEFKDIQIIPHWNEVCTSQKPPLRENIISGGYMDWLHYYDIQFRLMREDFVGPLRTGICEYLDGTRKVSNVRVYKKVQLREPIFKSPHGVCYRVKLADVNCRIDWEHSKRLLHGSLLCLTPEQDNFKDAIFFATVIHRDSIEMKTTGQMMIMFKEDEKMLSFSCKNMFFTMVESCAYFEASQHILHSLQTAEVDIMPFTEYLIEGNFALVKQPQYLTLDPELAYNLTSLISEEEKDRLCNQGDSSSCLSDGEITEDEDLKVKAVIQRNECLVTKQVKNIASWPTCKQANLDDSQLQGIHMALTQELAVIQGPPGTGKTYVGLKIVEALLNNAKICNPHGATSPILIMCLTNHALDQFLEGILKSPLYQDAPPSLVRIGGRSQSKELAKLNLVEIRKTVFLPYEVRHEKRFAERAVKKFSMSRIKRFLSVSNTHLTLPLKLLAHYNVMHPDHYSELHHLASTTRQSSCVLEMWLGLDASNSKKNKMIDSVIAKHKKSQKKPTPPTPNQKESSCEILHTQVDNKEIESDTESLIDVAGDATVEQSMRILDDEHESDKFQDHGLHFVEQEEGMEAKTSLNQKSITMEARTLQKTDGILPGTSGTVKNSLDNNCDSKDLNGHKNFSYYKEQCLVFDEERAAKILSYGFSLTPMSEEEATNVWSIHDLAYPDQWRLYQYWHTECLKHLSEECEQDFLEYNRLCSEQANVRRTADCFALESAEIIGMTTTGAAKYQHILHRIKPRIVIVEEAAEVLEAHIVSALNAGTQHLILIGDHKQLRPKPNEYELAVKYKLDVSLFERLIRNDFPHATLQCQHRMRPEIAELVKPHIYPTLSNHHSVKGRPDVRGVKTNLFFINHGVQEEEDESLFSHSNFHEASYLVSLCRYLLQQRYNHEEITILVTYTGQLRTVRKLMPKSEFEGVRVCTVDNFQGEENAIILLSLVRSNSEKNVGFLKEENRVCVALSRARQGFYCIGNFDMLREKVPLWDRVMTDMEQKGKLGDGLVLHCSNHPNNQFTAIAPEDFEKYSPKGGCLEDCNFRLECGHCCAQKCHYTDPDHLQYKCTKKCIKSCSEGHKCRKPCYAPCGECEELVFKIMPNCEHEQRMPCHKDPSEVNCIKPCKKSCPEGHACPLKCHQDCQPCQVKVKIIMPSCQHEQWKKCYQESSSIQCRAKCLHSCPEGHPCPKLCSEECGKCIVPVSKTIQECNHQVVLPCSVEPIHEECTVPCDKTLPCQHQCQLQCGEDCSTGLCMETVTVILPSCGHEVQVHCYMSFDLSEVSCDKQCDESLPCGHRCDMKCGEPCQTKCMVTVSKEWPCGHKLNRPCYQITNPEEYPCKEECLKKFNCNHFCSKECGQICDEKCQYVCTQVLSCGHKCMGKCSQCAAENIHKLCLFKRRFTRFCGHSFQTSCSGLMDDHAGNQKLTISCYHDSRQVNCSDEVFHTCNEQCWWNCEHFKCSKLCHEICERPRCNKRCRKRLKCGHQCYGLCGEPCLSLCPQCKLRHFESKLRPAHKFDKRKLYYELPCSHIFPVYYLDEYLQQLTSLQSHTLVCPIMCPLRECSQPLNCSGRYGNSVKQNFFQVQDINIIIKNCSDIGDLLLGYRLKKICFDNFPLDIRGALTICKQRIQEQVCNDEKYLLYIFTETVRMFEILVNKPSQGTAKSNNYVNTVKQVETFLTSLSRLIFEHRSKLTYQVVEDMRNQFFRVSLHLYILLAKSGAGFSAISPSHSINKANLTIGRHNLSDCSSTLIVDDSLSDSDSMDSDLYALRTISSNGSISSIDQPVDCTILQKSHTESNYAHPITTEFSSGSNCAVTVPAVASSITPMTDESSHSAVIDAAEQYLENVEVHSLEMTKLHCEAIKKFVPTAILNHDQTLEEMGWFYPAVQKGQWWKCPSGSYYCLPPSHDDQKKCPHCDGLYNAQLRPKDKASLQISSDKPNEDTTSFWHQKRCDIRHNRKQLDHHNDSHLGTSTQLKSRGDRVQHQGTKRSVFDRLGSVFDRLG